MIAREFFDQGVVHGKGWPPIDREDTPCMTFTCRLCGWQVCLTMFGEFPIGDGPDRRADRVFLAHLELMHTLDERRKYFQEQILPKYEKRKPEER